MRLVVQYHVGSIFEGYTTTFPAEYESAEALYCDIESAYRKAKAEGIHYIEIGNYRFDVTDLEDRGGEVEEPIPNQFVAPAILSIDEWFHYVELQGE